MPGARRGGPDGRPETAVDDGADGSSIRESRLMPYLVSVIGVLIAFATVGEWVVLAVTDRAFDPTTVAVQVALILLPGVALVYAGVWASTRLRSERQARVVGWCLGGVAASVVVNVVLMLAFPPDQRVFVLGWLRTAVTFGAVAGSVVGLIEARAIERSIGAERARVRTEEAERQRERLAYLNRLLRHEVLNAADVVIGHTSNAIEDDEIDEVTSERLAAVHRQGQRLADVVENVRLLTEAMDADPAFEPVDLTAVLATEVQVLRDRHESVTVETDFPAEATVMADDLLCHAFGELLENAVEHDESDQPAVRVAVTCDGEQVTVKVADDGAAIPPAEREAMFERETAHNHGLGLYLVRTLVERYDGRVELTETGDEGSVFTVELPRRPDAGRTHPSRHGSGRPASADRR